MLRQTQYHFQKNIIPADRDRGGNGYMEKCAVKSETEGALDDDAVENTQRLYA